MPSTKKGSTKPVKKKLKKRCVKKSCVKKKCLLLKKKKKKKKKPKKKNMVRTSKLNKAKALKFYELMTILKKIKSKDFNILSKYLNEDAVNIVSDCVRNSICSRDIPDPMRKKLRAALLSKKNYVRQIANSSTSTVKRRKLIPQIGGNIGLIIASVLPIVYNFLKSRKVI